jgi:hypothetical protein
LNMAAKVFQIVMSAAATSQGTGSKKPAFAGLRWSSWGSMACIVLVAACATPPKAEAPQSAAPAPTFEALMAEATRARQEGSRPKERDTYRVAAAAYPTRKEAWARLAESYFEAKDYGNAILAAQEVLQRDGSDPVAHSMLAVSGLRVSTAALTELRRQKTLNPDTRAQAEEIVGTLREALGQEVLVPKQVEPVAADAGATRPRPAPPRVVTAPPPATTTKPAAAGPSRAAAPATAPAKGNSPPTTDKAPAAAPSNPFDKLR